LNDRDKRTVLPLRPRLPLARLGLASWSDHQHYLEHPANPHNIKSTAWIPQVAKENPPSSSDMLCVTTLGFHVYMRVKGD
jgi:hypothetical protein